MRRIFLYLFTLAGLLSHTALKAQTPYCSTSVNKTVIPTCSTSADGQLDVYVNGVLGGPVLPCTKPELSAYDCTANTGGACNQSIGASSANVTVTAGQKVCMTGNYTGALTINGTGSTIVICGSGVAVTPSSITLGSGATSTIIVNTGTTFTVPSTLAIMRGITVKNYGTTSLLASTFNISTTWENSGTLNTKGVIVSGQLINYNTVSTTGAFTNRGSVTNGATFTVSGTGSTFTNNGTLTNNCQLSVATDLVDSTGKAIINNGGIFVGGWLRVLNTSSYTASVGSRIITTNAQLDGKIRGPGSACAAIKVSTTTNITSTATVSGYIDICDATGIDTKAITISAPSTTNCSCTTVASSYTWASPLSTVIGPTAVNVKQGSYNVTVQPAACSTAASLPVTLTANNPVVAVTTTPPSCNNGTDGKATVTLNGTTLSSVSGPIGVVPPCTTVAVTPSCSCSTVITDPNASVTIGGTGPTNICIAANNFKGNITFAGAGSLTFCGDSAQPATMNFNVTAAFNIYVNRSFIFNNFNLTNTTTIKNYGTILSNTSLGFNGVLYNYGTITVGGDFSINGSGVLNNYGTVSVGGNFNNLNKGMNYGTLTVNGTFTNNSQSSMRNFCKLTSKLGLILNDSLINQGTILSPKFVVFNGTTKYLGYGGSILNTDSLRLNGGCSMIGMGTAANCASVRVNRYSSINSTVTGPIDICDVVNGIDNTTGMVVSSGASTNCSCMSSVSWSSPLSGGANPITSGLVPGTQYTVSVNPAGCGPYTQTFTAANAPAITATFAISGKTVTVTPSGGTSPYTYTFSGQSTGTGNVRTYVNDGRYTVTIVDKNGAGCSSGPLSFDIGNGTSGACNSINVDYSVAGKVTVSCNCPGPCNIIDGKGNPLPPGTAVNRPLDDSTLHVLTPNGDPANPIHVVVQGTTDVNNTDTDVDNNNDNGNLNVTYVVTDATTEGSNNGKITLTVTGGSGTYDVTSSVVGSGTTITGTTISGLPGGTVVRVTVIDKVTGYEVTRDITVGTLPVPVTTVTTHPSSTAGSTTVQVNVDIPGDPNPNNPTPGPITVTYSTDPTHPHTPGITTNTTGTHAVDSIPVPNGTTTITATITDGVGRTTTQTVSLLPVCSTSFTPAFTKILPSCYGKKDGQIALTNQPASTSLVWSGASSSITTATATGLGAGTYGLLVIQSTTPQCQLYNGNVPLTEPGILKIGVTNSGTNYTALATGGTPAYTYKWSNNASNGATSTISTPGIYTVTVTDSKSCSLVRQVEVTSPVCNTLITLTPVNPSCPGAKDGQITASTSLTGVTYTWTGPGIATTTTTNPVTGLGQGMYYVSVKQTSSGCIQYAGISLSDPAPLEAFYQTSGTNTVSIVAKNGVPDYTVKWRFDNSTAESRSDLVQGTTYTVDVTDSRGCTIAYTFKYVKNADPIKVVVLVTGGTGTNTETPIVNDGTGTGGPYTYQWTGPTGVTISNPSNPNQSNLPNGTYTVTVTDVTTGSTGTGTIIIPGCSLTVTPSVVTAPACPLRCDGQAAVSVTPLAAGTTILWNGKASGVNLYHACADTQTVRVITPTGCAVDNIVVLNPTSTTCPNTDVNGNYTCVNNTLSVSVFTKKEKVCFSDDSYVDLLVKGGQAPYTYTWTVPGFAGGPATDVFTSDKEDLENPLPGNYSVTVKDLNNCTATLNLTVNGPSSALQPSAAITPMPCRGAKASATISATGGKAPYTFLWPDASTLATRTTLDSGEYSVRVTDALGCKANVNVSVMPPTINGGIYASARVLCTGETVTLTAALVPGYTWKWTGPLATDTSSRRSYPVSKTGTFNLNYTATGCTGKSYSITIIADTTCNKKSIICSPITLATDNPDPSKKCLAQKIIAAQAYGVYSYNAYLEEQKRLFKQNYINTIINGAQESLTMQYSDSEHQYTLYYYDQAGNLVRTVPPSGVAALDNNSETQAEGDLANKTNTVFTNHTLATTYKYNSLNQLVAQDVPDNTRQDLWEMLTSNISLGSTVPAAVAYGSAANGIMLSNSSTSGSLFLTADSGKTWTEKQNLGISDILDIQKFDASNAYAAGRNGTFLRSIDGGINWVVKSVPTHTNIVKVYFTSATAGSILTDSGSVFTTANSGDTWGPENSGLRTKLASPAQTLQDAWFDGADIWAVSREISTGMGHLYYYNGSTSTWTEQTNFLAGQLNSIQPDGSGNYLAAGPAGALITISSSTGKGFVTHTNLNTSVTQFLNTGGSYYALSGGQVYYSYDRVNYSAVTGITGTVAQLVAAGSTYLAATTDAKIYSLSGTSATLQNSSSGLTTFVNLRYIPGKLFSSQTGSGYLVLFGNNSGGSRVVSYVSASTLTAAWTTVTVNSLPTGEVAKDAWINAAGNWVVLGSNSNAYTSTSGTNAITISPATATATGVPGFYPFSTSLYSVIGGLLKSTNDGTTWTNASASAISTGGTLLDLNILSGSPAQALAVYNNQFVYEFQSSAWTDVTRKLVPSSLNAVEALATNTQGYVAGDNGEIYKRSTNDWVLQPLALSPSWPAPLSFSDLGYVSNGTLYLASGNYIFSYASGAITQAVNAAGTGNISNMDLKTSGNGLAVTDQGAIYSLTTSWNTNPVYRTAANTPLYAVSAFSATGGVGLAGGMNGKIYANTGSGWTAANAERPEPLTAVAYGDASRVIAVGKQGTILTSFDGGQSWVNNYSHTTNDFTTVTANGFYMAVAGGVSGTLRYTNDWGQTWRPSTVSPALTTQVNGVRTGNGSIVFAVSGTRLLKSTDGGANFANETALNPLPSNGNGIWIDASGYGFLVGDNSMAYRIAPNGSGGFTFTSIATDATPLDEKGTGLPAGKTLKTVQFTDRLTGYITGTNGLVLKTIDGGAHWRTESGGTGTGTPLVALGDGQKGTLIDASGAVSNLRDRAEQMSSRFWYDELARLTLSQNAKQYNIASYNTTAQNNAVPGTGTVRAYSYTLYDPLGRITEVGELLTRATPPLGRQETQVVYNTVASTFVTGGVRREITRTYYDAPAFTTIASNFTQANLRPRIASVTYQDKDGVAYDRATHYSYDIHGNVKTLIQEIKSVGGGDRLVKRLDYDYDLVSGKVNYVYYQKDKPDQFIHNYDYDGDNRITAASTSRDGKVWDRDAAYQYYGHGPMARVTIGQENVEVQDFAYTLQGWLKGQTGQSFSQVLGYFSGDYTSIGTNSLLSAPVARSLYNGNIATTASNTPALGAANLTQQYEYDQLNRITRSAQVGNNNYRTGYTYDLSGNITSLQRYNQAGGVLDQFSYNYETQSAGYGHNTNKLRWVDDAVQTTDDTDLEDQSADNYTYDDLGNLKHDEAEGIDTIQWNVYGKVKRVVRKTGSTLPTLEFGYDASGNRIAKKLIRSAGDTAITYYLRDASGNVMAVYKKEKITLPILLSESHIYGSKRIGISRPGAVADLPVTDTVMSFTRTSGMKDYELTDHLGDMRAVISDLRSTTGSISTTSASDFYPFGMAMPGRRLTASNVYRYGFNGKEKDDETGLEDYGMRLYKPTIARFISVDPVSRNYPQLTPYQFASNKPINGADLDGLEWILRIYDPQAVTDFVTAVHDKDVYKQRQIAYNAINSSLTTEQFLNNSRKNPNIIAEGNFDPKAGKFKGGELIYDPKAKPGVNFQYVTQNSKGEQQVNSHHWEKGNTEGFHDKAYPVDVRAFNSPEFTNYYGADHFVGWYRAGGAAIATATTAKGDMWGYLKGYGYVHYESSFFGISNGISALQGAWGNISGRFTGLGASTYDHTTLEGWGSQAGFGVEIFEGGFWQGYATSDDAKSLKNPTFIGKFYGINTTFSLPSPLNKNSKNSKSLPIGGGVGYTYSTLVSFKKKK